MNRIVLVGWLAADPELKYTSVGVPRTRLRIAVRDPFKKDDQGRPESDFFDVTCWRDRADYAAQYLQKGALIALHGRLCINQWVDQEGKKRRNYYVTADQIENWGESARGQGGGTRTVAVDTNTGEVMVEDYSDPFADQ